MNYTLNEKNGLFLRDLAPADVEIVASLAGRAFQSPEVAEEVRSMLLIYCQSGSFSIPLELQQDTLLQVSYYILGRKNGNSDETIGITGLYRPAWAARDIFWLGWFAIDTCYHGYGIILLRASLWLARARGGRMLCVETSPELVSAVALYRRMGFQPCGEIPGYWADGSNLLILSRNLKDVCVPPDWPA